MRAVDELFCPTFLLVSLVFFLGISRGWGKPQGSGVRVLRGQGAQGSGWGSPISDPLTPLPKPQAPPVTHVNLFLHTLRVVQL